MKASDEQPWIDLIVDQCDPVLRTVDDMVCMESEGLYGWQVSSQTSMHMKRLWQTAGSTHCQGHTATDKTLGMNNCGLV